MALSKIEKLSGLVNRISKRRTISTLSTGQATVACWQYLFVFAAGRCYRRCIVCHVPYTDCTSRLEVRDGVPDPLWLANVQSSGWLQPYRAILQRFFAVSLGVLLTHYLGNVSLQLSGFSVKMVEGVAVAKLREALPIVLSILAMHLAFSGDMDGLYLRRGSPRLWLIVGLSGFAVFAGLGVLQVIGSHLRWSDVWAALPWILIFIFSNAFMEELWFRALFLKSWSRCWVRLPASSGARF